MSLLTPSNNKTWNDEYLSSCEGRNDDGMKIKPFAKHPEKVTGHEVLGHKMKELAPGLQREILKMIEHLWKNVNGVWDWTVLQVCS